MSKMAQRLTDTGIWGKAWFRKFPPAYKLLWQYIKDNCNHAGIWDVDLELAEFQIGDKIGPAKTILENAFKERIISIQDGTKWFIPSFIDHQYKCTIEDLNPENKVHKSVIEILKREGVYKDYASPMQGAKDKDKDKELDKDKERKYRSKPKNLKMVIDYFIEKNIPDPVVSGQKFFDHYEANGWFRGKTKIKSWKHCLSQWDFSKNESNVKAQKILMECVECNRRVKVPEKMVYKAKCEDCGEHLVRV